MKFLLCSDPFDSRKPDPAYENEVAAIEGLGLEYCLFSYEALVCDDNPAKALRGIAEQQKSELTIYRGWMLKPGEYKQLYDSMDDRNMRLVNDPEAYRHCHYLPESYSVISSKTPRSVWLKTGPDVAFDKIMELLRPFDSSPVIVKDFVKSRKHEWNEACYIPSASDRAAVERVVRRFLELQDDDLNEGLVFREYIEFEPLATHSKSGMPLTKEFRIFFFDGRPIYWTQYWEEGDYAETFPPLNDFLGIARAAKSCFFTMDVAKRLDGEWMIVELGDAQVAGLPESVDPLQFYKALQTALTLNR